MLQTIAHAEEKILIGTGESSPGTKWGTHSMPKASQKAKKTGHFGRAQ